MCPFAQLSLNSKIKDLTGSDPFSLMFNRVCNIFDFDNWSKDTSLIPNISAIASLEHWQEHQKKLESIVFPAIRKRTTEKQDKYNKAYGLAHTPAAKDLPIGTLLAIKDIHRTSKNGPPMLAPYTIISRVANGAYNVRDLAGGILNRPVPIEHIRPLYHAIKPDTNGVAYMDSIHDRRLNSNTKRDEYLVKWSGLPISESTWIDVANIHDYAAITEYLASLERIPKTRKSKRVTVNKLQNESTVLPISKPRELSTIQNTTSESVIRLQHGTSTRGRPQFTARK